MRNTKYYILIPVVLLTMSFTLASTWYVLKSKKCGFKIEFPEKPASTPQVLNSAVGKLRMEMYVLAPSAASRDDNAAYLVCSTKYPVPIINSNDKEEAEAVFKRAIDAAAKKVDGKVLSEKDISIDGYPGKEVKMECKNGSLIVRIRVYLVENKMFLMETVADAEKDGNAASTRFMNSFSLLAK